MELQSQLGPLLPTIFNEEFGIIKCITEGISRKGRKTLIKPLVKWLTKLADKYATLLADYAERIVTLCCKLDCDTLALSGCEIFSPIVKNAPWVFHDVQKIFFLYHQRLHKLTVSMDGLKNIRFFEAVELMVQHYPDQLNAQYPNLWKTIVTKLHQIGGEESHSLISPCSKLLLKLTVHFIPDDEQCILLYKFFSTQIGATNELSCSVYEAILPFFTKMMQFFQKNIIEDCEVWHGHFLKHMKKEHKTLCITNDFDYTIKYPIDEFYLNIFRLKSSESKIINEYFRNYLYSQLENKSLCFYDAKCLVLWSGRSKLFLSQDMIDQFLRSLMDFIFSIICGSGSHKCYIFTLCVQSVFILIGKNRPLFEKHCQVTVKLMESLFSLNVEWNDYTIHSLQGCLLNIPVNSSDHTLRKIVYRNMLKHCSLKWPTCPLQGLNSSCKVMSCTGCSYSQFWKKLLDIEFFFESSINGQLGHSKCNVETTLNNIWNYIVEFIFHLGSSLNFTMCKNNDPVNDEIMRISSTSSLSAVSSGDLTLHHNATHLLCSIADRVPPSVWEKWEKVFLIETSLLSSSYPYISAFCKLVMVGLELYKKMGNRQVVSDLTGPTLKQFFLNCFYYCERYDGELRLAYIYVILNMPPNFVVGFEDRFESFFEITLKLARDNTQLAIFTLSTIRRWIISVGKYEMKPTLSRLVTSIIPLVKVQYETRGKLLKELETESYKVLHELFILVAYMDKSQLQNFYSSLQYSQNVHNSRKMFNFKLSTNDLLLDIDLDLILPQVFFLASHSSNFKERLRSCEFIHLIGCFILGKGLQVGNLAQNFIELFGRVISISLELAQDGSPMIKQIFNPFIIQCSNLFSYKLSVRDLSLAFTESLLDYMMQPRSETSLYLCCESLKNLLKMGNPDSDQLCQTNLEVIVNSASKNLLHPSFHRQKGAALALLSVKKTLFSETRNFDKYGLYMIFLATSNLIKFHEECDHILELLTVIRKAAGTHHHVLHEISESRVSPPGFVNIKLADVISWLIRQAVSSNTLATRQCCQLLTSLASCFPGICDAREMINSFTIQHFIEPSLISFADLNNINAENIDLNDQIKLSKVTCHITFLSWLIENYDTEFLNTRNWLFINVIGSMWRKLVTKYAKKPSDYPLNISNIYTDFMNHPLEDFVISLLELIEKLENNESPWTNEALKLLNSYTNFTVFLHKFLLEPSTLEVRFEMPTYPSLCNSRLKVMSSSPESSHQFMNDVFSKIGEFLEELPEFMHKCKPLYRSHFELFQCLGLLCENFQTTQIYFRDMKKMMSQLSDGFVCFESCDHEFPVSYRHPLSKLLKFIFSLGTCEEVCSELFINIFSDTTKSINFYDQFEIEILKFVDGLDELHSSCLGDMSCGVKTEVIKRILAKFSTSSSNNKFAACVMKSFTLNWHTIVSSINVDNDVYMLLDCLRLIGNLSTLGCFFGTDIEIWIEEIFQKDASSHLFGLLIPFMDPAFAPKFITDTGGKEEVILYLMAHSIIVGHFKVVSFCLEHLVENNQSLKEASSLILSQFTNFDPVSQGLLLSKLLQHGLGEMKTTTTFHLEVLPNLVLQSSEKAEKDFFSDNILTITECIFKDFDTSTDIVKHEVLLIQKSLCFSLICTMFGKFNKEEMFGLNGFLTNSLDNKVSGTLRLDIIKWCYKMQSCKALEDPGDSTYLESWRICQCNSLNCLLVLLCSGPLSSKVLQHMVFQDKTDQRPNPIIETIVDSRYKPKFISWQEVKQIKRQKKRRVDTGIRITPISLTYSSLSSYPDVSITSSSQQCKAFDFIRCLTSRNASSVVEVDIDADDLNSHPCLPYLCAAINKTAEWETSSSYDGKKMPEWMTSLNALLRNPKVAQNVKPFIVKIVHKCEEIFKPYAVFWCPPILHTLTSLQCCGDITSYFFYQITKMLISWSPSVDLNQENEIMTKLWNRLLEKCITDGAACIPADTNHILRILKLIIDQKQRISPPYDILLELIQKQSRLILGFTLKICRIFFENGFLPYTQNNQETFLCSIKNALIFKETSEDAAVIVGYFLKCASDVTLKQTHFEMITEHLNKLDLPNKGVELFALLGNICKNFPDMAKNFLPVAISQISNPKLRTLHNHCMDIIECYVGSFPNSDVFNHLKRNRFFEFIHSKFSSSGVKRSGLNILKSFIGCGEADVTNFIVHYLIDQSKEYSGYTLKAQIYDIMIAASGFVRSTATASEPNLLLEIKEWLFKQLLEESRLDLQDQLIRGIIADHIWKGNTRESLMRFLELFQYSSNNRNISTSILKTLLLKSLQSYNMEDNIFEELTVDGDIEACLQSVNTATVDPSLQPLFIETVQDEYFSKTPGDSGFSDDMKLQSTDHASNNKTVAREIKYIRMFGYKKLPDIRITHIELISIIQALCEVNKKISSATFAGVFNSVLNPLLDHNVAQRFETLIPILLNKLVRDSSPDTTFVFQLLNFCLKYSITLEPILLYDLCTICKNKEIGVLLAEQNITRLAPPLHGSFKEQEHITVSHYSYMLTMFHDDLGHFNIASSLEKSIPHPNMMPSGSTERMSCMQTIFSQKMGLKELALLGDWNQLNQELKKLDMIDPNYPWDDRWFRRNMDYRILSEINVRMLESDNSSTGTILEWFDKHKKNSNWFELELGDNFNILCLVNNRLDEFKIMSSLSAINWTYFIGLNSEISATLYTAKLKKSLDNYVMTTSLNDQDRSIYYNQLEIDELDHPENPDQWHQLINNRDYFLSSNNEKSEIPLITEKAKVMIKTIKSNYRRFLISQGILQGKHYASESFKVTCALSHDDISIEQSMLNLLESKNHQNEQLKLKYLWTSWDCLGQGKCDDLDVSALLQLANLCSEFLLCMNTCKELDQGRMRRALISVSSDTDHLPLNEAIIHFGHESLSKACKYTDRTMVVDVLVKTAEFCMEHLKGTSGKLFDQLNETAVRCILEVMNIGNHIGQHMLLRAVNIVVNNPHTVPIFHDKIRKIDLSSFDFWLPQLIGYLNSESAQILEPLLLKLIEKYPQKLSIILNLYKSERINSNFIVKKLLKNVDPERSGMKFVDAMSSVCHPNIVLRSYLNRLMKTHCKEEVSSLYEETKEKCFFNHNQLLVGRLFLMNEQYRELVDTIFNKKMLNFAYSDEDIKKVVESVVVQRLERSLKLESFSPFLSSFNSDLISFELPRTDSDALRSGTNSISVSSFGPYVTPIQSLRKPVKIVVIGSDGINYFWMVKFGEDLRQDQYIQQIFTIINSSMKRRNDWTKENIITYKILPFTPMLGIIEMVDSTSTMSSLMNSVSEDILYLRDSLRKSHANWILQALGDASKQSVTMAYARAAEFYSVEDIKSWFLAKSKSVPKDLLRNCLLNYSGSPTQYFHQRLNFLRSHTVLSLCHWVVGVGDRHLSNFLLATKTCELIGIDFGFSFGGGVERFPVPELVPFRLTPQFFSIYVPTYKTSLMEDTMVKCFTSIDKDIIILALQVLVQLPLDNMERDTNELNTEGTAVDHGRRMIESVERKLSTENPLNAIHNHLNCGKFDQYTLNVYSSLLQRFSHFPEVSSPRELVKMLIEMASNEVLLALLHDNYESWI